MAESRECFLSSFCGSLCLLFVTPDSGVWSLVCGAALPCSSPVLSAAPELWQSWECSQGPSAGQGLGTDTEAAGIKSVGTFLFPVFTDLEILPWSHIETNYCHSQKFLKGQEAMKGQKHCIFCTIWYLYQYL